MNNPNYYIMTPQRIIDSAKKVARSYEKKGRDFTTKRRKKYPKLSPKIEKQLFIAALAIVCSGILQDIATNLSYQQSGGQTKKTHKPTTLIGTAENMAGTAFKKVEGVADDVLGEAEDVAGDVLGEAKDIAGDVLGKVEDVAGDVLGKVEDVAGDVLDKAEDVVGKEPVKFITSATETIGENLKDNAVKLADEAKDLAEKSVSAIPKVTDSITAGLMLAMEKSGDLVTKLIDLSTLGILDKKWDKVAPDAVDRVKLLTNIVEQAQYDPKLQSAIEKLSEKVGTVGSQILEENIAPSLGPITKNAVDLVKESGEQAAAGLSNTGVALASAAVAEIPVMGGLIDLGAALGKGFNTGAEVFNTVVEKGSPIVVEGAKTYSGAKETIDKNTDELKKHVDKVQTATDNLTKKVANKLTVQKGGLNQIEKNKQHVKLSVANYLNSLPKTRQNDANIHLKKPIYSFINTMTPKQQEQNTAIALRLRQSVADFSKSLPQKYKDKTKEQLLLQSISTLVNSLPKIEKNKRRLHNSIAEFKRSLPKTRYIKPRTYKNRTRRKMVK